MTKYLHNHQDDDDQEDLLPSASLAALFPDSVSTNEEGGRGSGSSSHSSSGSGTGSGSNHKSSKRNTSARKRKSPDKPSTNAKSTAKQQPISYNMVDAFAGISSFSHVFEPKGFRCVGHCENDPLCNQLLDSCWPQAQHCDDFYEENWKQWVLEYPTQLLVGGPSCVWASKAGKQRGASDIRSQQIVLMAKMAAHFNVRICLLENVVQALNYDEVMNALYEAFREVGYTLSAHYICHHSKVGGASMRQRVFFVFEQISTMGHLPNLAIPFNNVSHTPLKQHLLPPSEIHSARVFGKYEAILQKAPSDMQPSLISPTIMGYLHVGGEGCTPEWGSLVSIDEGWQKWRVMSIKDGTFALLLADRARPRYTYIKDASRLQCLRERIPVYSIEGLSKSCRAFGEPPVLTVMLILDTRFLADIYGLMVRRFMPEEVWDIQRLPRHMSWTKHVLWVLMMQRSIV